MKRSSLPPLLPKEKAFLSATRWWNEQRVSPFSTRLSRISYICSSPNKRNISAGREEVSGPLVFPSCYAPSSWSSPRQRLSSRRGHKIFLGRGASSPAEVALVQHVHAFSPSSSSSLQKSYKSLHHSLRTFSSPAKTLQELLVVCFWFVTEDFLLFRLLALTLTLMGRGQAILEL